MSTEIQFVSAVPILASLDIKRSVGFFCTYFDFTALFEQQGVYGVVVRDAVSVHFTAASGRSAAGHASCRIRLSGVDQLYEKCLAAGIVQPDAHPENKPWGSREFGVTDPDGNLIIFAE
jgi:uncharacterized glyoxalase superfamily protein PhnB